MTSSEQKRDRSLMEGFIYPHVKPTAGHHPNRQRPDLILDSFRAFFAGGEAEAQQT